MTHIFRTLCKIIALLRLGLCTSQSLESVSPNSVSRLITTGKCGENGNAKRQKVRKGSLVSSVPWTYTGALALQGNTRPKQSSLGSAALPKMCVHDSCVLSLPTRPRTVTGVAAVATKALSFRFVHAVAGRKRYASWRKAQRAASQAP